MNQKFPRTTFKGLGGAKIALGLLILVIGVGCFIEPFVGMRRCEQEIARQQYEQMLEEERMEESIYEDDYERPVISDQYWGDCEPDVVLFYLAGACIALSILYIITGALGVGAARTVTTHRQSGLKTGFLVMCILNSIFFGPYLFGVGSYAAAFGSWEGKSGSFGVGITVAVLGFGMWVLSIVCASVSCCCSPIDDEVKPISIPPAYVETMHYQVPSTDDKIKLVDNGSTA